jgi:uncharacterized membrane protein YkoI
MLVIGLCLAGGVAAGDGYMEARRLVSEGRILPLEAILENLRQFQKGQVLEVEFHGDRRRMIYEIEILDTQGTVWELKVDAVSGELIEQELED